MPSGEADFLVIGSGIAGLFAAYKAKEYGSVLVVTKDRAEDSNTGEAQGGIAAAIDDEDSPYLHLEDTLESGAGLCDPRAVEILVTEGPARVMELVDMGARFDRKGSEWALGQEGAHRKRRILHAGDTTGGEIARTLLRECRRDSRITLREGCFLVDLLREPRTGRCLGALVMDSLSGEFSVCRGRVVIVATGGAGQLYRNTTNPAVATGDGMAAAYRAGAALVDLEFVQFHPTALALPGVPRFLISEAVRGEGAYLRNVRGERFMPGYHEMAELAPRDVVSRAIVTEMRKTGADHVYLDFSHLDPEKVRRRFPNIWRTCCQYGLDPGEGRIPVAPAAHYIMGGIATGRNGETSIPGLYACGEVSCSGVHGANRLASNSLLEGLVFGARAVEHARRFIEKNPEEPKMPDLAIGERTPDWSVPWEEVTGRVRSLMWEKVGIIRTGEGIAAALAELEELRRQYPERPASRRGVEGENLMTLAWLTARAALMRKESRGGHFRDDFPLRDDRCWLRHIVFQR
ncbi:MAG: L-aspartate oxidase [Clostridia bacterium]|nr:L-aspartate oxidase [Clostridia bacterium]MDN5375510.1 L-aspartate oxidase [Thermacetogenium sp.]